MKGLTFSDVTLSLSGPDTRPILSDVSMRVDPGETVGLVGESGSGKSTAARAAMGMVPTGSTVSGTIEIDGIDVLSRSAKQLKQLRSHHVAMIFQDPQAALNPTRTVGAFLIEQLCDAQGMEREQARARMLELCSAVGFQEPDRVMRSYPHQLSGGMLQRACVAAAVAIDPAVLLADEATSALDVTVQAEILALLSTMREKRGASLLLITHDLRVATSYCDRVYVMYAGRIVEEQRAAALRAIPRHPYSKALFAASPELRDGADLKPIEGQPPSLTELLPGCPFAPRCALRETSCDNWEPRPLRYDEGTVACRRSPELFADIQPEDVGPRDEDAHGAHAEG